MERLDYLIIDLLECLDSSRYIYVDYMLFCYLFSSHTSYLLCSSLFFLEEVWPSFYLCCRSVRIVARKS